jgi:hypothetical protein
VSIVGKALVAITLLVFLIYPFLMRGLAHVLYSTHLRAAELGRELLLSPFVRERDKEIVNNMLDHVFDWKFPILTAVFFPFSIGANLAHADKIPISYGSGPAAGMFGEFIRCFMMSMFAVNPVFAGISFLELALMIVGQRRMGRTRLPTSPRVYVLLVQTLEFRRRFGCGHCR